MPVPTTSQLHRGTSVNIILKADQRSGKLTTGQVAETLTKGDHPRGIKVRLTSGQIGRVQSLSLSNTAGSALPASSMKSTSEYGQATQHQYTQTGNFSMKGGRGLQQDVREDGHDPESREQSSSLFDYVRPAKQRKAAKKVANGDVKGERVLQADLEAEFPMLDLALVAAIMADHPSVDDARDVLKSLI